MTDRPHRARAQLIDCPSVTPASGEVFDILEEALKPLGFIVHRWILGEPPDGPTENMVAIRGQGTPLRLCRASGRGSARRGLGSDPFAAEITDGILVGRGASDMKSAIAAFVAALPEVDASGGNNSLLITGDEEGHATFGTPR